MSEDAAEAAEAAALMAKLGVPDVEPDDDDDEPTDPEDILEKYRRTVEITPDNCLDQVILGTSDIEAAVEAFEKLSGGIKPCFTTSFNGTGTKTARVAFEECAYLELIGPDPKQSETEFSKALAALPAGELVPCHYAVRLEESKDLEKRREWSAMGMEYDQITMVAKDKGMPWFWDMYFIKGDGLIPFLTDWSTHDSMHASSKYPICGTLSSVSVSAPADHKVHKLLKDPANMDLSVGSPKLEFTIDFKNGGSHTFTSTDPVGISYPEEGGVGS